MIDTQSQYKSIIEECRQLFQAKMRDYGTSWRILRPPSVTDQILIKARRIRNVEESGVNKVGERIENELVGIINYSIIAIIQLEIGSSEERMRDSALVMKHYDEIVNKTVALLGDKNQDYDEAWRHMRVSSIIDIIMMKLLRVKMIENNEGNLEVSEGLDANFMDIINYSVFALILLSEKNNF